MTKNTNSRASSLRRIVKVSLIVATVVMGLPGLSLAAIFAYVNSAGNVSTVSAETPYIALATAPNIHVHSGVMLLTANVDVNASIIGPLSITTTSTGALINWNTTENTNAIVYYSTTPFVMTEASANTSITISGSSLLVHSDLRSTHSANLTGLQSNTTYYYIVYVRDGAGNESITWPSTLRTN